MLTTPDNLLFFHLFDDGLQDKLLHHLSRDGGEADRSVVPWVLLALFEDWSDMRCSHTLQVSACAVEEGNQWEKQEDNSDLMLLVCTRQVSLVIAEMPVQKFPLASP